jgi:hypothetical protein
MKNSSWSLSLALICLFFSAFFLYSACTLYLDYQWMKEAGFFPDIRAINRTNAHLPIARGLAFSLFLFGIFILGIKSFFHRKDTK